NRSKPELEVLRAEHKSTPLTEREQIEAINARVAEVIRKGLADRGILPFDPGYGEQFKRATYAVTAVAGRKAGECRTVEEAEARLRAALSLWERVSCWPARFRSRTCRRSRCGLSGRGRRCTVMVPPRPGRLSCWPRSLRTAPGSA